MPSKLWSFKLGNLASRACMQGMTGQVSERSLFFLQEDVVEFLVGELQELKATVKKHEVTIRRLEDALAAAKHHQPPADDSASDATADD